MAHLWDRGTLNASSWHGLEEIGTFTTAAELVAAGERTGAWPVAVQLKSLAVQGFECEAPEEKAVVASYAEHRARCVGVVGGRYTATTPESWRSLVEAAAKAGAKPTGAFSLRNGRVVIGTFEINGRDDGIATNLLLADAFDGSQKLCVGTTSVRVVCANTLSMAMHSDGAGMAQLRHTSSINDQVSILAAEIESSIEAGKRVRDLFQRAKDTTLSGERLQAAFDALFPVAPEDASPGIRTRAENARQEARIATQRAENYVGGNLASLWNAATWLVDRTSAGSPKALRQGAESLDSLIFGTRGKRVEGVYATVERLVGAA